MASKSSNKSSGGSPRSYSQVYKNSAAAGTPAPQPAVQAAVPTSKAKTAAPILSDSDTVDWYGEYGYVLDDLRVLGLVTAGLLAAIIVLSFFF